jgi:hypothetical protein
VGLEAAVGAEGLLVGWVGLKMGRVALLFEVLGVSAS